MSIFIVSDGKFTISESKFIVLSCFIKILDNKNDKNSDKFIVSYHFCLEKNTETRHSEKQLSFEWYNNFFVVVLYRFESLVKKVWPQTLNDVRKTDVCKPEKIKTEQK